MSTSPRFAAQGTRDACPICNIYAAIEAEGCAREGAIDVIYCGAFSLALHKARMLSATGEPSPLQFCEPHGALMITGITTAGVDPSLFVAPNAELVAKRGDS